ncbi:hypothetical protein HK096_003779 [Nowakowskiella sp. JEL0078]|nr:hypothetical protein HK096_003779 [Nowakowskiella sp. JEL0078]
MNAWEIPRSQITFSYEDVIANGGTSTLIHGCWLATPVAIKILRRNLSENIMNSIIQEVSILYPLRHPHIIQVYGACLQSIPMLVLEVPPILHGDLKSVNVLVSDNRKLKIADFGFAKVKSTETSLHTARGIAGTMRWLAPERLHRSKMTESADVYSFAMVMYEILSGGKLPFELDGLEEDPQIMMALIKLQRPSRPESILCNDNQLWNLMEDCWQQDPIIRPTFPQIVARLEAQQILNQSIIVAPSIPKPIENDAIAYAGEFIPDNQKKFRTNTFIPFPTTVEDRLITPDEVSLKDKNIEEAKLKKLVKIYIRKKWVIIIAVIIAMNGKREVTIGSSTISPSTIITKPTPTVVPSLTLYDTVVVDALSNCMLYCLPIPNPAEVSGTVVFSKVLKQGKLYKIVASGIIYYAPGYIPGDARYMSSYTSLSESNAQDYGPSTCGVPPECNLGLHSDILSGLKAGTTWKNNTERRDTFWGTYSASHNYAYQTLGSEVGVNKNT